MSVLGLKTNAFKTYFLDHLNNNTYNLFHKCALKQPKKKQVVQNTLTN